MMWKLQKIKHTHNLINDIVISPDMFVQSFPIYLRLSQSACPISDVVFKWDVNESRLIIISVHTNAGTLKVG